MERRIFLSSLALSTVGFTGCNDPETNVATVSGSDTKSRGPATRTTQPEPVKAVFLGDQTRIPLLEAILKDCGSDVDTTPEFIETQCVVNGFPVSFRTSHYDEIAPLSKFAATADIAVLAMDARTGLRPVHRQHILLLRQMNIPNLMVVVTNSDAVVDPELLELEEIEVLGLLELYQWRSQTLVAFDSKQANVEHAPDAARGISPLASHIAQVPNRPAEPAFQSSRRCSVEVYVLMHHEGFPTHLDGLTEGEYDILLGQVISEATVSVAQTIPQGSNSRLELIFESPCNMYAGQRCIILVNDRVGAIGVVTDVSP